MLPGAVYDGISENRVSIFAQLKTSLVYQPETPVWGYSLGVHRRAALLSSGSLWRRARA